jgi:hypothetical protein
MGWLRSVSASGVVLGLCLATAVAQTSSDSVGLVFQEHYNGALGQIVDEQRELRFTDPVYFNELVRTGPESTTALQFLDATRLQVGANSVVVLDRYVFDPNSGTGEAVISFGTGVFRFITGQMANKDGFHLRTPTAVMAIRGTKLIVAVLPDGTTLVAVLEGELDIDPCELNEPVHIPAGYYATVTPDCSVTVTLGTFPVTDEFVLADLPALDDIVPAAGPTPPAGPLGEPGTRGDSASPS